MGAVMGMLRPQDVFEDVFVWEEKKKRPIHQSKTRAPGTYSAVIALEVFRQDKGEGKQDALHSARKRLMPRPRNPVLFLGEPQRGEKRKKGKEKREEPSLHCRGSDASLPKGSL